MKNLIILFILVINSNNLYSQDVVFPEKVKKGDIFISCESKKGKKSVLTKVLQNLSTKDIKKIQSKLKFLGYNIENSGVLDDKTKKVVYDFNVEECGICSYYITEKTVSVLDKNHRKFSRDKRKKIRKAKSKS